MGLRRAYLAVLLAAALPAARPTRADDPPTITDANVVTGTVTIDFATRTRTIVPATQPGAAPASAPRDTYTLNLNVARTTEFTGDIVRQPRGRADAAGRAKQDGRLIYGLNIAVLNPKDLTQKKRVGRWLGDVPIDPEADAFDLGGGRATQMPLRVAIDSIGKAQSYTDPFAGKLIGRFDKGQPPARQVYARTVGGKRVKIDIKQAEPITFQAIELAKGPANLYPRTTVNGRLDFDPATRDYFTSGITFTYALDGKTFTDQVAGSIRWIADAAYNTNGTGRYAFNLRFNDGKPAPTTTVSPKPRADEAAFFAVDDTVPCLTGTIDRVDAFAPGTATVVGSRLTYRLDANRLTKQQIVNFFKLWVVAIGPMNEE